MMRERLKRHAEKIRFMFTGAWNTVFGLLVFAALYSLFSKKVNYMVILVISNVISITNAYVCYKFIVFRTKGNYLREYLRFYVVYGISMLANIGLMFMCVHYLGIKPVMAQAFILAVIFATSYVGHKFFSFKTGMSRKLEAAE